MEETAEDYRDPETNLCGKKNYETDMYHNCRRTRDAFIEKGNYNISMGRL